MFEVEKHYTVQMLAPDGKGAIKTYRRCRVIKVDMPLITIRQPLMDDAIINTSSPVFVKAIPEDD
jgi:hypothetical protein